MKIEELVGAISVPPDKAPLSHLGAFGAKRNEAHPEIAELLNAHKANMLFNSPALARDEIELANFIISMLDMDHHYVPSETLLQAIRTIDDKIGGTYSMAGMIRTA